jgi:hypothetical protein
MLVILGLLFFSPVVLAQYDITLQDGRSFEGRVLDLSGGVVQLEVYVASRERYVEMGYRRADIFSVQDMVTGRDLTVALLDGDPAMRERAYEQSAEARAQAYPSSAFPEERSAVLRSPLPYPLPAQLPAQAPYWDTGSDPLAYQSEVLVNVSSHPDRTWISGLDATYAFRPLRHDHLYGSVPGKRIIPQSWLGLRAEYGPIRESLDGYFRGSAFRVEGAVKISESVGVGGMVMMHDWKHDYNRDFDPFQVLESGMVFAAVVDLYPSRRVHLREKIGSGSVDYDREDPGSERFTYDTENLFFASHTLDLVFGRNAYSHSVELQYFSADFFVIDFVQYLEFAGNPDLTFAPMMRVRSIGDAYGTSGSFSSYGIAFRWYISSAFMLQLEPQLYARDTDGHDRMEVLVQGRFGVRF